MKSPHRLTVRARRPQTRRRRKNPASLEILEQRQLLATFTVTSESDSGAGTLRQAILDANANANADVIEFNITGGGFHTLAPVTPLPTITQPVRIDGYTQGGASVNSVDDGTNANLTIQLLGVNAGDNAVGLLVDSPNVVIRGLVVSSFTGSQIQLNGGSGVVEGCFIGTSVDGKTDASNGGGVVITSAANTVGGVVNASRNLISGNVDGVSISAAGSSNVVAGNLIGVQPDGAAALGNSTGVRVSGPNNTVGGNVAGARNVIGTNANGIMILGGSASGNVVAGNNVGLRANGLGPAPNVTGITVSAPANTIGGTTAGARNVISGNSGVAVRFTTTFSANTAGNLVAGNYIGLSPNGDVAFRSTSSGIRIEDADGITVGGTTAGARNILSGNHIGIHLFPGATQTTIVGNYTGTDGTGTIALDDAESATYGIYLANASDNTIGGTAAGARNVLVGRETGIALYESSRNLVQGNFIGLEPTGASLLGASEVGVLIFSDGKPAVANTIGGLAAGAGNVITGNSSAQVQIDVDSPNGDDNVFLGNLIGTDSAGTKAFAGGTGILVANADGTVIGGTAAGAGNVIAGCAGGIELRGATGSLVQGNRIGVNAAGTIPLANKGYGIFLSGAATNNSIGGITQAEGNIIANTATLAGLNNAGIRVASAAKRNRMLTNSIFNNAGLGIDLQDNGVSTNDFGDSDTGANDVQNFPLLTKVVSGSNSLLIEGSLNTLPNKTYVLQFFANVDSDASQFGEGEQFLDQTSLTIDPTGTGTFSRTVTGVFIPQGYYVTATATDPSGNTSEFSQQFQVLGAPTDLGVTITDSPDPVVVGQTLTYTVTAVNLGNNPATGVSLVDTLSANVTLLSATATQGPAPVLNGNALTAALGTLAPGASASMTIRVTPNAPAVPAIQNSATVTNAEGDTNNVNNSAVATTVVSPLTDLSIVLTDGPDPALVGQDLTYTFTVRNSGPNDATNVVASHSLPAGATLRSSSSSQGTTSFANGVVTATLGSMANGAAATVIVVVRPTTTGTLTSSASVAGDQADTIIGNNSATAATKVNPAADLSVQILADPTPALLGQPLTISVSITNSGPNAAVNVRLVDTLPKELSFVSAQSSQGTAPTFSGNQLTANLGNLAIGASALVTITVTPTAIGTLSNSAVVSLNPPLGDPSPVGDPNPVNNTATIAIPVQPAAELGLQVLGSPVSVLVGQDLNYTLNVINNGPSTATGVVITDQLPASVTFISATPSQGTVQVLPGGRVVATLGSLATGVGATVTIKVQPQAAAVSSITNSASVDANEADPDSTNNAQSVITVVNPLCDVELTTIQVEPTSVLAGQQVTFTLGVRNNGPNRATDVRLTDFLPIGVSFVSAQASQGAVPTELGGVVTALLGALDVGQSASVSIVAETSAAAVPSIMNRASVSAFESDSTPANNDASAVSAVRPAADVSIVGLAQPSVVQIGDEAVYQYQVTNIGPNQATGIVFTSPIPAGLSFIAGTVSSGEVVRVNQGMVTTTLSGLAPGQSADITVRMQTVAAGTFLSIAQVIGGEEDPLLANNATQSSIDITAAIDLGVTIATTPNPAFQNQALTYTVNLINRGPSRASNVDFDFALAGVDGFDSFSNTPGLTVTEVGNELHANAASIPAGGIQTLTVVVTPTASGVLSARATAAGVAEEEELNASDNTATLDTFISAAADLEITPRATANPAPLGKSLFYTIDVTNHGPASASSVVLTDALPNRVDVIGATTTQGQATINGKVVTADLGTLAPSGRATVTIEVVPRSVGLLNNTSSVVSALADPVSANSTDVTLVTAAGVPGEFALASAATTVGEGAGAIVFTVQRVGGSDGPASVLVATGGGTATPGFDYTPVAKTLFFDHGVTAQQVTLQIVDNAASVGDRTVFLNLSNPAGGAKLGSPASTLVTITENDFGGGGPIGTDKTPPILARLQRFQRPNQSTRIRLTFNESLDLARAQNISNYALFAPGADGRLGTGDDVRLRIASVVANAAGTIVNIRTRRPLDALGRYRFVIDGSSATGVSDTSGHLLDGNYDGVAGGDYRVLLTTTSIEPARAARRLARGRLAALLSKRAR